MPLSRPCAVMTMSPESCAARRPHRHVILAHLASLLMVIGTASPVARADVSWHEMAHADGGLTYAVVLPPDTFTGPRPALLALPPGNQSRGMVEAGLNRYWGAEAAKRGWIVISPVAPEGSSFWSGAEAMIPDLLDHVAQIHAVAAGRFHLAGASNGGRSAFRVAGIFPDRFRSITVLPGFPPTPNDEARLPELALLPIAFFAGGADTRWVEATHRAAATLEALGADVTVRVLPDEGHVPPGLDGPVMMDHLERVRMSCEVRDTLDAYHAAAAVADGPAYFELMTDDAVFIGTDPTERWTKAAFKAFAEPYFSRGTGWTYTPVSRHVVLETAAPLAWFDEDLDHARYGRCRGTGVLRRTPEGWRIAQYVLTIPIPNEVATEVVEQIRELGSPPP